MIYIKNNNLSLREKLIAIRKAKGVTQEALAIEINYGRTALGDVERGTAQCDLGTLMAIKTALDIQGLPLFEEERKGFLNRLYLWNNIISECNFDQAKQAEKDFSRIKHLPFDLELNAFYSIFSSRLMLGEEKFELAANVLVEVEQILDTTNNDLMYWYYNASGALAFHNKQCKKALDLYIKAYNIMKGGFEENKFLHYNIARCLSDLGYFTNVIMFMDNVCNFDASEQANIIDFEANSLLALNCIKWGYFKRASKLLEKCLLRAEKNKNEHSIGSILHNFGYMYRKTKSWAIALHYFDEAFMYLPEGTDDYLGNLYQKTSCLVDMGAYAQCLPLILEGKKLSETSELYTILFQSLEHLATPNENASLQYLETHAIPYLLNMSINEIALEYSDFLRKYYEKNGGQKKHLKMSEISRNIHENVYLKVIVE